MSVSNVRRDGYYEVFSPRSPRRARIKELAPRLGTLDGKLIAQLWTFQYRGDEVFEWLEEGLKARFPRVRFVNWREFGSMRGSNEREAVARLPKHFKELGVDAVITGMGC